MEERLSVRVRVPSAGLGSARLPGFGLAFEIGNAMGSEAKSYGVDIILAPGMNLHRNPLCGRNFEYFSEDPVLSGNIAAGIVKGIQKNNVGACPKHFVVNNQETDRMKNNALVDERTLREIYLKGFEIMVKKSQPWAIMSSYNKLNGKYVTVNKRLLTSILREEWGFKGTVMTDWFGGGDTVESIKAGNDLIEPGTSKVLEDLEKGFENQKLSDNDLNIAAGRILKLILRSNKMNNSKNDNSPDLKYHAKIVREKASEGMINPFQSNLIRHLDPIQKKNAVLSYGCSSYGYDLRLSSKEFLIFKHVPGTVMNPKKFNPDNLEKTPLHKDSDGEFFILPAHSYGLGVALEKMKVPENITVICIGKSTYARLGIIVNTTPAEAGWEGHLTLEFSNSSGADCRIYANEGICQLLFFEGDPCSTTYEDRKGKYQNQPEQVTLAKI